MTNLFKKFLHHLKVKNCNRGITLIELLVVLLIIGILSAIAWLFFLRQIDKARETQAVQDIANSLKLQNAYYNEVQNFTDTPNVLGYDSQNRTKSYFDKVMLLPPDNPRIAAHFALSKNLNLQSYVGALYLQDNNPEPQWCKPFPIPDTPIPVRYPKTDQELVSLYYSRSDSDWASFCK